MRWPVVIFDLDGTLVDSVGLIVASYQNAFRLVLGHEWADEAEIKTWIGLSLRDSLERIFPGQPAYAAAYAAYIDWNESHMAADLRAFPGIPDLMADLAAAGLHLGTVTSKRAKNAAWSLELGQMAETVPLLVSHDETDRHKPDPEPLLLAAHKLAVAPGQCVYVGDAATDIEAAHNAGMSSIGVTWGAGTTADLTAAQPVAVCDTVEQLRTVLLAP